MTTQTPASPILDAVRKLRELVRRDPAHASGPLVKMADLYLRAGNLSEARRVLEHVLRKDPFHLQGLMTMCRVLLEAGEPGAALPLARAVQRAVPALEEACWLEHLCLERMNSREALVKALRAYLGRFPARLDRRLLLASWLERLGRPAEALAQYRHLVQMGYRPAEVHERIGALHFRMDDLEPALIAFRESDRLVPGNPRVREATARVLYALERYEDALAAAESLLQVAPESVPGQRLAARAAMRCRRFERAVVAYERVLEASPESLPERLEFAEALFFAGDRRESAEELRRVLAGAPRSGVAHFRLAEILRESFFFTEAVRHYRAAAELLPDSPSPLRRLGEMALADRRHKQAAACFLRWMMLEPASPAAHAALGLVYREAAEMTDSRRHFERAAELGDCSASLAYERARLERACGQAAPALELLAEASRRNPDWRQAALIEHEKLEIEREERLRTADESERERLQTQVWKKLA